MDVRLVVLAPAAQRGTVLSVRRRPLLVGRAPACHVRASGGRVSRVHCAVFEREGRAYVQDLGSTHGTFVNGQRAGPLTEIRNGDRIQVGAVAFEVQFSVPASPDVGAAGAGDSPEAIVFDAQRVTSGPDDSGTATWAPIPRGLSEPGDVAEPGGEMGDARAASAIPCPQCGHAGDWVPPTRFDRNQAVSTFRCDAGHTWEIRA